MSKPFGIPIHEYLNALKTPTQAPPPKKKRKLETQLLTEKYRPANFFDLCGNDDANRQILRWLNYWKSIAFQTDPILNEFTDHLGRPKNKILLLAGPPGTGKTTAAHVIANQAGFNVLEVNASDERGSLVVEQRITQALQSHQVHNRKPVCVVLDEIEGASEHGFIKSLIKIIQNKKQVLKRPIIAICNNAWAQSMHSLRPFCEMCFFNHPPQTRIFKQLEEICLKEGIQISSRDLRALVDQCDCDIRACLVKLQYSSMENVTNQLDSHSLVRRQFGDSKPVLFDEIMLCPELDKLVLQCFSGYVDANFNADLLKSPSMLGDYLALCDNKHSTNEVKSLMVHACGQLFRSPAQRTVKIELPFNFGKPPNHYETNKRVKGVLNTLMRRASSSVRTKVNEKMALMELIPLVVKLSSPKLNTIQDNIEKGRLKLIANLLTDVGIKLKTERQENGTLAYTLDPPIDEIVMSDLKFGNYVSRAKIKEMFNEKVTLKHEKILNKSVKPVKKAVDFSAFMVNGGISDSQKAKMELERATRVWIQYSEGFSNAVRKNITWDEL